MKAFDNLVVGATVRSLNSEIFKHGYEKAQRAVITVSGGNLRFRADGGDPNSSLGLPAYDGDVIELIGFNDINLFRAIRSGATDATLNVDYS